jgi:hypothetical protein
MLSHGAAQLTARGVGAGQLICIGRLTDPAFDDVGLLVCEVPAGSGYLLLARALGSAVQRAFPAE